MDPKKSSENIEGTFQDAIDPMTGFLNRSGFYNFLSNMLGMASSENKCILMFTVKLLNYKRIIELWSETESKSIIGATAKMISHCLRGRAVCSRSSEDRFMIAGEVPDDGLTTANSVREELIFRFDNMNKVSGKEYTVNPEISYIIIEPNSGMTPDEALSRIIAKSRENADSGTLGRFLPVREEEEDPGLKNAVTRILDNNEFDYHFQPIVSANTGDIVGYEALMRMPKEYGVSPLTLLKYASEENRLSDVERATMFNVMKRTKQLSGILGNRKVG